MAGDLPAFKQTVADPTAERQTKAAALTNRPKIASWLEAEDLRVRLLTLHVLLGIIVVTMVLIFASYARRGLERDVRQSDIALARAIANEYDDTANQTIGQTTQEISRWMSDVWGEQSAVVTLVTESGTIEAQLRGGTPLLRDSQWAAWSVWQRSVLQAGLVGDSGSFESTDPDGDSWLHSFVTSPTTEKRVIIQRPTAVAFATLRALNLILALAVVLYLGGGLYFWMRLYKTVISPLEQMATFSGLVSDRQPIADNMMVSMRQQAADRGQIGRLSQSLLAMESAIDARMTLTDGRLQEKTGQLEAIVESLDAGLLLASVDDRILYCNQKAATWTQIDRDTAIGMKSDQLLSAIIDDYEKRLPAVVDQVIELSGSKRSYQPKDLHIERFSVRDTDGELIGYGQIWQDVTRYLEVDRMKSALMSSVSHELRTPLTAIRGFADMLLYPDVDWAPEKQHKFLSTISVESERLQKLIENLLDMSRIEGGRLKVKRSVDTINRLVEKAIRVTGLEGNERVERRLNAADPDIWIDSTHVLAVMRNYIENAVKYSPAEKPIRITTSSDDNSVTFTVRDYGDGVPADLFDKLFQPFFRADNRMTREVGGVGLGLAICKGLIEAHDGRVWAERLDDGMLFAFQLPLKEYHDEP